MTWIYIIPIIFFGLLLVFLEIFLLPGLISGIIGGILVIYGVYQSYINYGSTYGSITLFITILVFISLLYLFFKSGTWKKVSLGNSINSRVNTIEEGSIKVGDIGIAISRLAPMGKALINNDYFEVRTNGDYIEEEKNIEIIKIEGNKIYVKIK